MHFTSALVALLATAALAAPATESKATKSKSFGMIAINSGTAVQNLALNAVDGAFWLNRNTTTSCPKKLEKQGLCPNGTDTVVTAPGKHVLNLDVSVPGGQQVYVNKNGLLEFTQAHSASLPEGSLTKGFTYKKGKNGGVGDLSFHPGTGFTACPDTQDDGTVWYTVGVNYDSKPLQGCLSIAIATIEFDGGYEAYQYV